jgi:SNF2-related domain/Helicase conserved C-terminal domain
MSPIESLGLSAKQWQFLLEPGRYIEASCRSDRPLAPESTRRQFLTARDILARLNGSNGTEPRRGILLADDVGLGKTTVAALVAWVVASAGEKGTVRILAPNDVMMRRWVEEMRSHVAPFQECAEHLGAHASRVKVGRVGRLNPGSIQVVKHSYAASEYVLDCDLLIVDEAHRAKGSNTAFSAALKRQKKHARRVLILTATPFSIRLEELEHMLWLVGGDDDARAPVRSFSRSLTTLYSGNTARSPELVAESLATKARAAVEALSRFVIRHGIDDLKDEQSSFGSRADWNIDVPPANPEELELMVRMDRTLRVANQHASELSKATNDPRFHVGWRHFDAVREDLRTKVPRFAEPSKTVVENQLKVIDRLRRGVGIHSKMRAVAAEVKSKILHGEKVLLFCHHHATAQELTAHLASVLPKVTGAKIPPPLAWRRAWDEILEPADAEKHEEPLRNTFIEWLSGDLIRSQTWGWLGADSPAEFNLVDALKTTGGRYCPGTETLAAAAQRLFHALVGSKSSRAVLMTAADHPDLLPGANGTNRVLGICTPSDNKQERSLFLHNQQPDTVISIFNSPFGPDVLVVTDKLSEGIDLHRYCRHLIHYELDPSPIRTVQRNGRLRRVNSWAAVTGQSIYYAYPAFRGTRDHRLVQIMKKRTDNFSLLLGGVQDFDVEEVVGSQEAWRNQVIALAKTRLAKTGGQLRAREPT